MTIKGTKQACAACKYQRRKCEENCRLARYFPADQPRTFRNAHRLFGVGSIGRILDKVDDDKKDIAMSTIIYESNMRERYPVHGCWGLTLKLQQQLKEAMDELRYVDAQLAIYKDQCQYQTPGTSPSSLAVNIDNVIFDQGSGNLMPQGAVNDFLVDQIDVDEVKPIIRNIIDHQQ